MSSEPTAALADRLRAVRLLILDVDGVLTDGRLLLPATGPEVKIFHARDGMGLRLMREHGLQVAIISGRHSPVVSQRMAALDIEHVYQGQDDKCNAFIRLQRDLHVTPAQCAYLGDDVQDLPVMRQVGLPCAVADAHPAVRRQAAWVTTLAGGRGAVRELCDLLLGAQGRLPPELDPRS